MIISSGGSATGGATGTCTAPPAAPALLGWASVSGTINGTTVTTTTGGGDAAPVTVTTLEELKIPESVFPELAKVAMTVARPLANNPCKMTIEEMVELYQDAHS